MLCVFQFKLGVSESQENFGSGSARMQIRISKNCEHKIYQIGLIY